jgi:hypothetical protein
MTAPAPAPEAAYAVASFEEFWPHYVRMHTRPATHALHALGTLSAVGLAALAIARRSPLVLVAAPLADYALSQAGHRLFEGNATSPWKNHAWHARAELRMLRLVLTGRMQHEVLRYAQTSARPTDAL